MFKEDIENRSSKDLCRINIMNVDFKIFRI